MRSRRDTGRCGHPSYQLFIQRLLKKHKKSKIFLLVTKGSQQTKAKGQRDLTITNATHMEPGSQWSLNDQEAKVKVEEARWLNKNGMPQMRIFSKI